MENSKVFDKGQLIAKRNTITIDTETVDYNELFTLSVLETINEKAREYYLDTPFVNELFRDYFLPLICIERYLCNKEVRFIDATSASNELRGILCDYAETRGIKYSGRINKIISQTKYFAYVAFTSIYLGIKQFRRKTSKRDNVCEEDKTISICRTPAAYKKIIKIYDKNVFREEKPGEGTVYDQLSKKDLFRCLRRGREQARKEIKQMRKDLFDRNYINIYYASLSYYKSRVVHTFFYENVVEQVIINGDYSTFITGNNLDRFAVIEEEIAKRYNLELICIPHGIEYGYRFPKCFIGDRFFTTSECAAQWLNRLYGTDKFVFDNILTNKMFKVDYNRPAGRKVVFFSEPRESNISIEILEKLARQLNNAGIRLFLKLHPKDSYEMYKDVLTRFDIGMISDLNEAICGNVCVARKSTTLIEALYNESSSYAIIINEKDKCIFRTFPSLQDPHINYYEDISDLAKAIENEILK